MATDRLNVIGLISGGKDSFFSLLHCIEHGHRVIALANLFPAAGDGSLPIETQCIKPDAPLARSAGVVDGDSETDLNSFMYQTVGHEVIPLYSRATGLPLYRRQIHGGAVRHERDYDFAALPPESVNDGEETESMVPLLRSIMEQHPEANAVCAGAILSTYQRTRVESIALRLGLTPLAFLWKYPVLPSPVSPADDAQLLKDMADVGLDARIIKVASAGLDEDHLWLRASSYEGSERIKRALRKFGAAHGAALGEGGEFETLVIDGPQSLFRGRIGVPDEGKRVVREGGGTSWMKLKGAEVRDKKSTDGDTSGNVRCPGLLDSKFQHILDNLTSPDTTINVRATTQSCDIPSLPSLLGTHDQVAIKTIQPGEATRSIQEQTSSVVEQALRHLQSQKLEVSHVSNTVIVLRDMADFPAVNAEYSKLFPRANPPSRVTISCGDLLPKGVDIILSICTPRSSVGRQGLHVQSRSYWAPANIGPYSQAISTPLISGGEPKSLRCISIAGQIPLIPATMALPEPTKTSLQLQITLSLQHLWRIGVDMQIQYWSGAVAYFSRTTSEQEIQQRAHSAGYAWREIHRPPADDEDDEAQLDPWDLKHNSEFMTLGDAGSEGPKPLPDWSLLPLTQQNDWESRVPPFFAAEVESLPRQAEVEWHAQIGISGAEEGAVQMFSLPKLATEGCAAWHMLVRESDTLFLHTTVSHSFQAGREAGQAIERLSAAYEASLEAIKVDRGSLSSERPYLLYVDAGPAGFSKIWTDDIAVVPCHSLWSSDGRRQSAVAMYRSVFS